MLSVYQDNLVQHHPRLSKVLVDAEAAHLTLQVYMSITSKSSALSGIKRHGKLQHTGNADVLGEMYALCQPYDDLGAASISSGYGEGRGHARAPPGSAQSPTTACSNHRQIGRPGQLRRLSMPSAQTPYSPAY